jgi:hypothetical protein
MHSYEYARVADPHNFNADPNPAIHFNVDPDTDTVFHFNANPVRIQIVLLPLIKEMRIFDHWSTDPPGPIISLQASIVSVYGLPRLYFQPLGLVNFDFNADPDPGPVSYINADPYDGPGSASLE